MFKRLRLVNFRNYPELDCSLPEGFSVLSGPNGSGKSNLLESMYYLSAGYSYRQMNDENLVYFGRDFFAIKGEVIYGKIAYILENTYQKGTKRKITKINNKREISGKNTTYFPVVIFSPQDLLLIQGAPSLRRRFIDMVITQSRPQHTADLHNYQEILTQRNNLLKRGVSHDFELEPWNEQLITVGARILSRRTEVFNELIMKSRIIFSDLGGNGSLGGVYLSKILPPGIVYNEESCRNFFLTALKKYRPLEERLKVTVLGPHRDDLKFILEEHDARLFCSQGEQRLVVLALKIGQSRLLAKSHQVEPLLLLDDVFSELDEERKKQVMAEVINYKQVIATTTVEPVLYTKKSQLTPNIFLYQVESLT